jgi:hypothetical protein
MDPTRWLKQSAPGFAALSISERRAIKDFSLLWSFFECTVLNGNGNANEIIRAVRSLEQQGKLTLEPFVGAIDYFRTRYWDGANLTDAFEGLHLRPPDRRPLVERVIRGQSIEPVDVLSAILIIVFRFRNNLFHGIKWAYGIRDQLGNFRNANDVLMATIDLHQS